MRKEVLAIMVQPPIQYEVTSFSMCVGTFVIDFV